MDWENWFRDHRRTDLLMDTWSGPRVAFDVEEMYQAFKARMMSEAAESQAGDDTTT